MKRAEEVQEIDAALERITAAAGELQRALSLVAPSAEQTAEAGRALSVALSKAAESEEFDRLLSNRR